MEFFNIKRGSYHNQNNITPSELLDTENQPIIGEKHLLEKNRSSIWCSYCGIAKTTRRCIKMSII